MEGSPTRSRKAEHIDINLHRDVDGHADSGFDGYRFLHDALPGLDLDDVDTGVEVLGWRLRAPLFVSCMTGGVAEAASLNRALAVAAQEHGLVLGLGSGRVLLERPEASEGFMVRDLAPDVPLLANLGAVQLNRGVGVDDCRRLVTLLHADALVLHLNALQEALQPEGDTCFAGLLPRIAAVARELEVPVIVKEVGWGLAPDTVCALLEAGVAAVDVAGAGGTSWSEVERHRVEGPRATVAEAFASWGTPTTEALAAARAVAPDAVILASGGVRSGVDVAVAVALGADLVGAAGPFLRAAAGGEASAVATVGAWIQVLRIAMFCTGAATVSALRTTDRLLHHGAPLLRPHRRGVMQVVREGDPGDGA